MISNWAMDKHSLVRPGWYCGYRPHCIYIHAEALTPTVTGPGNESFGGN